MTSPDQLAPLIITQLETVPNLTVFDGEVGEVIKDDGVSRPYATLYMSPGNLLRFRYCSHSGLWSYEFQVTVTAGTVAGLRLASTRVLDTLTDLRLEPLNRRAGPVSPLGDPGPERTDKSDPDDIRLYVPLLFRSFTTRS